MIFWAIEHAQNDLKAGEPHWTQVVMVGNVQGNIVRVLEYYSPGIYLRISVEMHKHQKHT
jgi:hypothetical protein